jgi:hypothetical protein
VRLSSKDSISLGVFFVLERTYFFQEIEISISLGVSSGFRARALPQFRSKQFLHDCSRGRGEKFL